MDFDIHGETEVFLTRSEHDQPRPPPLPQGTVRLRPVIRKLLIGLEVAESVGIDGDRSKDDKDLILRVDRIENVLIGRPEAEDHTTTTIRVWLSDGVVSIQALFMGDALQLFHHGAVTEGSCIALDDFQVLKQVRLSGAGFVCVILISAARAIVQESHNIPETQVNGVQLTDKAEQDTNTELREAHGICLPLKPRDQRSVIQQVIDPSLSPTKSPELVVRHDVATVTSSSGNELVRKAALGSAPREVNPDAVLHGAAAVTSCPEVLTIEREHDRPQTATPSKLRKRKFDQGDDATRPSSAHDERRSQLGTHQHCAKKHARPDGMSPEKAIQFHSDRFYEALKAIHASPTKTRVQRDLQSTTTSPTRSSPLKGSPTKRTPLRESTARANSLIESPPLSQRSVTKEAPSPSPGGSQDPDQRRDYRHMQLERHRLESLRRSQPLLSPSKQRTLSPSSSPKKQCGALLAQKSDGSAPSSPTGKSRALTKQPRSVAAASATARPLKVITRPVQIVPLAAVTGRHARRSRIIDVLVVIAHVNSRVLVRSGFPDSRELLVTDCSMPAGQMVHLTVFVNAHTFRPASGTVALLRNITTHEYGGGSLKAYYQRCKGTDWFITIDGGSGVGKRQPQQMDMDVQVSEPATTSTPSAFKDAQNPGFSGAPSWQAEAEALTKLWQGEPLLRRLPEKCWWTDRGASRYR